MEPLIIPPTGTERCSTLLYRNAPKSVYQMRNLPHDISRTAVNPQVACEERASPRSLPREILSRKCGVKGTPPGRTLHYPSGGNTTKTRDDGTDDGTCAGYLPRCLFSAGAFRQSHTNNSPSPLAAAWPGVIYALASRRAIVLSSSMVLARETLSCFIRQTNCSRSSCLYDNTSPVVINLRSIIYGMGIRDVLL